MKLTITNARLSFPKLFSPKAFQPGQEPSYGCTFILDKKKDAKQIATIRAAIAKMEKEELKGVKLPEDKVCLRDGASKADIDGYGSGVVFLSTSSKRPPVLGKIEGGQFTPVTEADQLLLAGYFVNGTVNLWAQNNQFGKRINCQLRGVIFRAKGEVFGEGPINPDEEFAGMDDSDDSDLPGHDAL